MTINELKDTITRLLETEANVNRQIVLDVETTGIDTIPAIFAKIKIPEPPTIQNSMIVETELSPLLIITGKTSFLGMTNAEIKVVFEPISGNKLGVSLFINVSTSETPWVFSNSFPDLPTYRNFSAQRAGTSLQPSFLNELPLTKPFFVISTHRYLYETARYQASIPNNTQVNVGLTFIADLDLSASNREDDPLALVGLVIGQGHQFQVAGGINAESDDPLLRLDAVLDIDKKFGPFQFEQPFIGIFSSLTREGGRSGIEFGSHIVFSETFGIKLHADIPIGHDQIVLQGKFDNDKRPTLPGLGDLATMVEGKELVANLPDGLQHPTNFGINLFELTFAPKEGKITHARIILGTAQETGQSYAWDWFNGAFVVKNISMEWEIFPAQSAADQTTIILAIFGDIEIGGGNIFLVADVPDLSKPKEFQIFAALNEGETISLTQLVNEINRSQSSGRNTVAVPGDKDLAIDRLHLIADPVNKNYSFDIGVKNLWEIEIAQGKTVAIYNLEISLNNQGEGYIAGLFIVADLAITITASHSVGQEQSWQFAGSTGQGQAIPIGKLIADLVHRFNSNATIPATIADLIIENLRISFNTRTKDFSFSGETQFPIGNTEQTTIDAIITIDLKHQTDGSVSKLFSGNLTAAGLQFDLIFDLKNQATVPTLPGAGNDTSAPVTTPTASQSQTFLALYRDPTGVKLKLDDLLQAFGVSFQTGLYFTIKEALLAYHSQTTPGDTPQAAPTTITKWLFGIDIEGGLDLSKIHLDALPFITIPPDQSLTLAFQALIASQAFQQIEIEALNTLAGAGGLGFPAQDIKTVKLNITLNMGQERKQLDLPIDIQTQVAAPPAGSGPQTSPVAGSAKQTGLIAVPNATPTPGAGGATVSPDGVRWVSIQKTLGPLRFERVGLKYDSEAKTIQGWLDAALTAGGLTIALNGLSVSSPFDGFNPTFSLQGLAIDYRNGPLEIGGTFLKRDNGFAGLAVIRTEVLTLSAIGAYSYVEGQPSLFIYAILNYPLGGPAFFYVTGLAAGFGYNRQLLVPTIDQIATFPLVVEAVKGDLPPMPADQQSQQQTLTSEINKLGQYIPPAVGQNFLAVGLKFTTFKQVNSFALLVVQFGQRFEIDLLGLSTLLAPTPDEGGQGVSPVAEAQMALKATFIPDEGFLGVQAQLTANSYILSRACQLTGGFAFFSWFSGPYGGDFVITLGGYHPAFKVPAHYPQVPRLGFAWQVNPQFYLKGGLYFALTGHALMTGGNLDALFQSDNIRAWFKAGADFLISWKPYHYDISVFVDMGIEVTFEFFGTQRISLSAGANLHLWGPKFAGQAHVEVKVLFFTIPLNIDFGSSPQLARPITWADFRQSFLPAQNDQVCSIAIQAGLVRTIQKKDANGQAEEWWVMNAKEMILVTNSVIPSTQGGGLVAASPLDQADTKLAIQPMGVGVGDLSTTHTITITGLTQESEKVLSFSPVLKSAPTALWGPPQVKESNGTRYIEKPDLNGDTLVKETLAGFEIRVGQAVTAGATHPIERQVLQTATPELAPREIAWLDLETSDVLGEAAWAAARDTVVQNAKRDALLAILGLQRSEIDFGEPIDQDVVVSA